jgi:hypothetical protein
MGKVLEAYLRRCLIVSQLEFMKWQATLPNFAKWKKENLK